MLVRSLPMKNGERLAYEIVYTSATQSYRSWSLMMSDTQNARHSIVISDCSNVVKKKKKKKSNNHRATEKPLNQSILIHLFVLFYFIPVDRICDASWLGVFFNQGTSQTCLIIYLHFSNMPWHTSV